MTTKHPRINVTFEETTAGMLVQLAHSEQKSVSGLVRELTLEALERREDFYLSKLANKLDKPKAKTFGHNDAWK